MLRQIAPGMVQQMQAVCPDCKGAGALRVSRSAVVRLSVLLIPVPDTGQVISEKDKCTQCRGNKVVQEKKILEVAVERGMSHSQKIIFRGEADEAVRSYSRRAAPGG
jgi:DnaJ family protein A protein 2